jgi:hypothetical protein
LEFLFSKRVHLETRSRTFELRIQNFTPPIFVPNA